MQFDPAKESNLYRNNNKFEEKKQLNLTTASSSHQLTSGLSANLAYQRFPSTSMFRPTATMHNQYTQTNNIGSMPATLGAGGLGSNGSSFTFASSNDLLATMNVRQQLVSAAVITVDNLRGKVYDTAKDQHGCRFLQR
uniref:Uncharacterized protein n=1 Tax=Lygus hesperus TaxID=30085 RepID=A0A0A9VZA4_LYGHE